MTLQKYAGLLQGIGLPNESQTATVQNVAGLDTQQPGWRIRHPQAMTDVGKFVSHTSITGIMLVISLFLGKYGSGAKETASPCACLRRHCLAATRSAYVTHDVGILTMIYTFLIATNRGRIADFQRIRTISAFAKSETEARQRLSGLPLVFLSRSPAQEVAA